MGIPPALWTSFCPFRVLRDEKVKQYLMLYGRVQRHGALPNGAALDDQDERVMRALDVMGLALRMELETREA